MIPHNKISRAVRRIWLWENRSRIVARARIKRGLYRCELCFGLVAKVEVDHLTPVGSPPGSRKAPPEATWDGFFARLFCTNEGLQVVCVPCHNAKTYGVSTKPRNEELE